MSTSIRSEAPGGPDMQHSEDVADQIHAALLERLERGDDLASLTSVLLTIEELHPENPRRPRLLEGGRQAIALCKRLQQYQQKESALHAVFETAQALTELKDLGHVLLDIVRRSRKLLRSDIAWLAGEDTGKMRVLAIEGAHTSAAREMSVPSDTGIAGHVMRTASAFTTHDYLLDPRIEHDSSIDATLAREGMQSAVAVPLLSDSEVIGVLILGDRYSRVHQPWEVSILATLAAHASVAIRNARTFALAQEALQQAERANTYLQEKIFELEQSAEAHDRIARQLSRGGSLQDMAEIIADMLHGEILFIDPGGRELCVASAVDTPAPRRTGLRQSLPGVDLDILGASERSRSIGRSVPLTNGGEHGLPGRITAVFGGDDLLGALVIRTALPLSEHEIRIFERGSMAMAVLALLAEKKDASERQDVNLTLRALLEEGRCRSRSVADRASQHGLDLSAELTLALIEVEPAKTAYIARKIGERMRFCAHMLTEIDERIVLLANRADVSDFKDELEQFVFTELMAAGIGSLSRPLDGAAELPEAYEAARRALSLLRKLGRRNEIAHEPGLSVYAILFQQHDKADMSRLVNATVGPLVAYDAARGTRLADTLLAFLDHGQNARATARYLGVHVNTIHNRIGIIHELIGPLDRHGVAMELHVALRLRHLQAHGDI